MVSVSPDSGRQAVDPGDGHVLVARDIEKAYRHHFWSPSGANQVLRGANVTLAAGEVVGLVGEQGSGKSTLMKVLGGALSPDAGTVRLRGTVGYCPQVALVYPRLTCDEHFELFGHACGLGTQPEHDARAAIYESLGFGRYARTRA